MEFPLDRNFFGRLLLTNKLVIVSWDESMKMLKETRDGVRYYNPSEISEWFDLLTYGHENN